MMISIVRSPILLLSATLALAPPAVAQGALPAPRPDAAPSEPIRRQPLIDQLFEKLKAASDANEARGYERQITRRWSRSGSDTSDLLMSRAQEAAGKRDFAQAIELLDRVIFLQPDWAEGWNQRANVFFRMEDHQRAALDVAETLKREPRHFGALAGLGQILKAQGHERAALKVLRQALDIHPHMNGVKEQVDRLAAENDGRDA